MQSALAKALELILTVDAELCQILLVTAKMSLTSSLISLLYRRTHWNLVRLLQILGTGEIFGGFKPEPDGIAACGMWSSVLYAIFRSWSVSSFAFIVYGKNHDSCAGSFNYTDCNR